MTLQRAVNFDDYFRCYVVNREKVHIMRYDPRQPHDTGVQPLDDRRFPELVVPEEKARARPRGSEFRQPIDQLVLPGFSIPERHPRSPTFQACAADA